jgi:glycosyltransferase involved in cell wall biosynthesis
VPNPVEAEAFRGLAEERRAARAVAPNRGAQFLFLGDVLGRKGLGELLDAFAALPESLSNSRLVVAGSGEIERYQAIAARLGVADRVEFAGWVDAARRRTLLVSSDAFVLPSHVEGVPVALLEAMASGLPSVVTPVGGVLDAAVPDETSLLVPPRDAALLRDAMVRLVTEPDLAERLGRQSQARALHFDVEVVAGQLDAIYRSILQPLPARATTPA